MVARETRGGAKGVAAADMRDDGPVPATLVATTRNRYRLPFRRPRTVMGLCLPVAWAPPGDAVTIAGPTETETIAKGVCNYSAEELRRVIGMKTEEVREILPHATDEAVHRDYLVVG